MDELAFEGLTKSYGTLRALDDVGLSVRAGGVHALLGENGAGKSTLLKVLSGAVRPERGRVLFDGVAQRLAPPARAFARGVAVIHQEPQLVPELSVEENLLLGHLPARRGWVDQAALRARARELLDELGLELDPRTRVRQLSLGQRQMVEVGKALGRGAALFAFDEATASLSAREGERLFALVRTLARQGKVVLWITHRMEEVFDLCSSASVLRDGRHVRSFESLAGVTRAELVHCMVGRELAELQAGDHAPQPHGPTALELEGLLGPGLSAPVSLRVARGEIVGLFGLVGAGRSELLELVFGARARTAGRLRVHGAEIDVRSPADAIRAGVLLAPEDRQRQGILALRSVLENVNLSACRRHLRAGLFLDRAWERANARAAIERLGIRTRSPDEPAGRLSGGNQQKTILARWLSEDPKVLLLDEPTRGIDVGARAEIYALVRALAGTGVGVLLVSSDLPEVLGLCERVLVMRQGRLAGELAGGEGSAQRALELALPRTEARASAS